MSSEIIKTTFVPNPTQQMFIESRAKSDLFSSRVGEGKSAALCWCAFYHTRHNPGARWGIVRDTWENLRDTTLQEFFFWFQPGIFGSWNESKKCFTWASGVADGQVSWLGMDDPDDASKLQSRFYGGLAYDEPAPAVQSGGIAEVIFDLGFSRLRQQQMNWYSCKLAINNPDETHWTYKRFVDPGDVDFKAWQPAHPENERNLPTDYYADLRRRWAHRPDMVRRFIEGKYGFTSIGKAVTPEWSDDLHLATGLNPVAGCDLNILWDFGLNPTCIITQVTPLREWLILDAIVGEDMGVEELIEDRIKPLLASKYRGFKWRHIGDPNGVMREQSSAKRSAVKTLIQLLGGTWRAGPKDLQERIQPLRSALSKAPRGHGMIQVDKRNARAVWQSLRGGWHFKISNQGVQGNDPVKDLHSHPGDAMGYGCAVIFPMGRLLQRPSGLLRPQHATFFGQTTPQPPQGRPRMPPEGRVIGV